MEDEIKKYEVLLNKLHSLTAKKKINWYYNSWDENLTSELGNHKVVLKSAENEEGEPVEIIEIRNNNDALVDSFADTIFQGRTNEQNIFQSHWTLMQELHKTANRQARGADDALDSILAELDDDDDDVPF